MRRFRIGDGEEAEFQVLGGTERSQAAAMTLAAGEATGGPDNRHTASDQWLFVVSGTGTAIVEGERVALAAGDLLLVAAGEGHEIQSAADVSLVTITVYAPPEY